VIVAVVAIAEPLVLKRRLIIFLENGKDTLLLL
jgi:hypothetical protein